MQTFVYLGTDASPDEIAFRGVTFPTGEAVAVEDPSLAEKIGNLPYFERMGNESGPETQDSVRADLDALGVEYDGRWGLKRLIEVRDAARG